MARRTFAKSDQPVQTMRGSLPAITWASLALALAIVVARCSMLESIREPFLPSPGSESYALGPNAGTSLLLDLLCCVPAILVLVRRTLDRSFALRISWSQILLIPLLGWMAMSIRWADDKFVAMISVADCVAAFALFWAVVQVVRDWLSLRLVAAVAYGLLLVSCAQGFYYKFVEVPDTQKMYQDNKEKFLKQRGWKADDFTAIQFEKKINSGEMIGFTSSPNSFAAIIVLLMVITAGLVIQRIADGDPPIWAVTISLALVTGIWLLFYTQSKAAIASPLLATVLFVAIWLGRGQFANRSRTLFWAGVAIVVLTIDAALSHGLYQNGLPTASLNFRWRYWTAAAQIFRAHPIIGVGWANFGLHYLRYRLPVASEEIKDPHNFIIRFFVELGAIGGILLLAWLLRLWWELTRPIVPREEIPAIPISKFTSPIHLSLKWVVAIGIIAVLLNAISSLDLTQDVPFITVEIIRRLMWLGALEIGILLAILRSVEKPELDQRPAPWILYAILIAIGVFLIHNLIEFSLFEPGAMCLFAVLAGAAMGIRQASDDSAPRSTALAGSVLTIAMGIVSAVAIFIVLPVVEAESDARQGDEFIRTGQFQQALRAYESAGELVPIDAEYLSRASRAIYFEAINPGNHTSAPPDWAMRAQSLLDKAAARNPLDVNVYLDKAKVAQFQRDAGAMMANFDKALELNPNEVSIRLEYARALLSFNKQPEAKEQLETALKYNDLLDREEPKRLSPGEVENIRRQIAGLK